MLRFFILLETHVLDRIHAIIIEDGVPFNKACSKKLRESGINSEHIYSCYNYAQATQKLNELNGQTLLFVLLDRNLGSSELKSGVQLYHQIINKFSNYFIVSITDNPIAFEQAIIANVIFPLEKIENSVFDAIIHDKKTNHISIHVNNYLKRHQKSEISKILPPTQLQTHSKTIFHPARIYTEKKEDPAHLIVKKEYTSCCMIS